MRDELGRFMREIRADDLPTADLERWLTDHAAYQRLVAVAHAGMDDVTAEAVRAIQWRIADAAQLGKPAADALIVVSIGPQGQALAAQGVFGQVNVRAVAELVGALQASSPLVALPELGADAVKTMQRELVRGLANGDHSRTIARRIARAADMPAARAATIARTEIHRAYREANRQAYQANPAVGEWRWNATLTARTCSSCWAMHGTVHSLDEPMGTHPNCRCAQLPVVQTGWLADLGIEDPGIKWPTGEEEFAQLDAAMQRQILGPGKLAAYQEGRLTLASTVHVRRTREWGTTRSVANLRDSLVA